MPLHIPNPLQVANPWQVILPSHFMVPLPTYISVNLSHNNAAALEWPLKSPIIHDYGLLLLEHPESITCRH